MHLSGSLNSSDKVCACDWRSNNTSDLYCIYCSDYARRTSELASEERQHYWVVIRVVCDGTTAMKLLTALYCTVYTITVNTGYRTVLYCNVLYSQSYSKCVDPNARSFHAGAFLSRNTVLYSVQYRAVVVYTRIVYFRISYIVIVYTRYIYEKK